MEEVIYRPHPTLDSCVQLKLAKGGAPQALALIEEIQEKKSNEVRCLPGQIPQLGDVVSKICCAKYYQGNNLHCESTVK